MNTQYSKAIDAIIYSEATKDFTKEEWLTLSNAAQDQMGGIEEKCGLRKIRDAKYPCTHPEHDPPKHMACKPGTYEYICPACGKKTVFEVPAIVW